ncbi:MAG: 3-deoxy-D-manno-octulosonic acid transferase [Gammaproteobacteria bacterium]|uniref:lipid IV(A) 3-deoxy-D-manno-octulosonic acid transferase n=1 Tax=Pseudomaricurvus alcaniphilus TaxID=1166482 RepID=UPI00140824EC|nr:lipid IV(A) 3-deoxy-D-manno-octulosonic acid transferase [Pseudomaricurvus alcaniphilus]MBR9909499.1 3-deoxy-D-manno-octulosonic acid transferase [Gammaproteobacteria bacterium]NHN37096.1 3-deoxy-D-manno-octulosonic acid transferase [Pseudomaricurvus alcaniphilus]
MRFLYTLVFYLSLPLVLLRLLWRARKAPAYASRWGERFGLVPARTDSRPAIWLHAVSVGETIAALPLLQQLQQRYPDWQLLVTSTTPTGSARVAAAFGDSVLHVYSPYDLPDCVGRFLRRMRPALAIIMETELWPNTIAACRSAGVPVLVANARLSQKSAAGYGRVAGLSRAMLEAITVIAAQSEADAERFRELGASCVAVTGNIKFDLQIEPSQQQLAERYRQRWQSGGGRPVLLAASTHEGEDERLLQSFSLMLEHHPQLLLVLVPRHPERFGRVQMLAEQAFKVQLHSRAEPLAATTQVLIGDSMGELMALLGASDLVFMGGTWVENGGHNFIEPAAWGKPIFSGPSLYNFAEVSRLLLAAGGLRLVQSPAELAGQVGQLLDDPQQAQQMGAAARTVATDNRGALARLLLQIDQLLVK